MIFDFCFMIFVLVVVSLVLAVGGLILDYLVQRHEKKRKHPTIKLEQVEDNETQAVKLNNIIVIYGGLEKECLKDYLKK